MPAWQLQRYQEKKDVDSGCNIFVTNLPWETFFSGLLAQNSPNATSASLSPQNHTVKIPQHICTPGNHWEKHVAF